MQRPVGRGLALVVVPVALACAACGGGMSYDEGDACNAVHAWVTGDREPGHFEETVERVRGSLSDVADSSLTDALGALEGSTLEQQAARAEAFLAVCSDEGWDLPEG